MKKALLSFLLLTLTGLVSAQTPATCPYANYQPNQSWTWPTHSKWFLGNVVLADFTGGTAAFSALPGASISSYEGTTSVASDFGNLLWYSNGQRLWNAAGTLSGTTLSTGNENIRTSGSAVQGILTVRHPLNPNVYHVFCADDVLSNVSLGLDHYTLDSTGAILSGPTKILAGRSYEGMSATWHGNGVDVWVMTQDYATGDYNAF